MAKLVEILAAEMEEWPEGVTHLTQSNVDREIYDARDGKKEDSVDSLNPRFDTRKSHSEDAYPIVTRAQWQSERDRQKGGEWKRHRGGKCPVPAGAKVSTRHRDGKVVDVHFHTATTNSGAATMNAIWKHTGDAHDIMSYKVISQPSSKAEARAPFGGDPIIEYAFGAPGEDMASLDWKPLGHGRISDIEFDDVTTEGVDVKDTIIGTLSYKVEVDTSAATQAIDDLAAKWDQVDGPLLWRDTVNELDAYIEEFTREREALINRLALEGFALIPAMTAVMGVADRSATKIESYRDWKAGDIVFAKVDYNGQFTKGRQYKLTDVHVDRGRIDVKADDKGEENGWMAHQFEFHSRP